VGRRVARAVGDEPGRRYEIEIRSGWLAEATPCAPPEEAGAAGDLLAAPPPRAHHQPRIESVILVEHEHAHEVAAREAGAAVPRPRRLFDVRIADFELLHPAEHQGVAYGTIRGELVARLFPESVRSEVDAEVGPRLSVARQDPVGFEVTTDSERFTAPASTLDAPTADRSERLWSELVTPDPAELYARMKWVGITLFLLAVGAGIARSCGGETAGIWGLPVAIAVGLRPYTRRMQLPASRVAWVLTGILLALHAVGVGLAFAEWRAQGCRTPIRADLVVLAAPVLAAVLIRPVHALVGTMLIWTVLLCSWCDRLDGGSCIPAAPLAVARDTNSAPDVPSGPRTRPDGGWPKMPPLQPGDVGPFWEARPGDAGPGAVGLPQSVPVPVSPDASAGGGAAGGGGAVGGGGEGLSLAAGAGSSGPPTSTAPPAPDAPAIARGAPRAETHAADGPRPPQVAGGWLAPDHRRASRELFLISLEHANRVPADFYDSRDERRVHMPTDEVFRPGGSGLRAGGELALARLAALLSVHPERHVVIDVHTDAGGSESDQLQLARRRATTISDWLLSRGHVDPGRIRVVGVGSARPLVPPDGPRGAQAPNRRLEIRLAEPKPGA